jgi:cysteine desulfurase family protein
MIYFDNAATTYPKPECVYDAINKGMREYSFNAGRGSYRTAQSTYKMIEETRKKIGDLIGVDGNKVIFTSSATESLNNIIYGLNLRDGDNVYVSPFEHNAIVRTLHNCKVNLIMIPFDKTTWDCDFEKLNDMMIMDKPKAVFISHISNVTGFMLPYKDIFNISKKFGAINVLDSAQGFGVYKVEKSNVDFVVFAGHKSLYAMFGIAGYINISSISLKPYKVGGTGSDSLNPNMPETFPTKYEAGSYNSVGIFSIFTSIDFLKNNNFDRIKRDLSEYFIKKIQEIDKIVIYLPKDYISHGIVSFNMEGYTSSELGTILAEDYDICVRTGYHCAPFIHDFIDSKKFSGTVRVSFSGFNTKEEIDRLVDILKEL